MAYDGSVLRAVIYELTQKLSNGRIDKIYQPEKDEIILNIRNQGNKFKLLLSASNSNPRAYITESEKENPQQPPAFCMLLRKHLDGGRICGFSQYKMDRIMKIEIMSKNELGDDVTKSLIIEIMGKYSNIILVNNENNKIIDSIKRVNFHMSRVREILPGLTYEVQSISDKKNPLEENSDSFINELDKSDKNKKILKFLTNTYTGISSVLSREILFRANIDENTTISSIQDNNDLTKTFIKMFEDINNNIYNPVEIIENNKIISFAAIDLTSYPIKEKKYINSISELLDNYYIEKDNNQRIEDKSSDIKKIVKNSLDRDRKKLEKQIDELNEAKNRDKYKIYADLISANIYKVGKGEKFLETENFYDNMKTIKVPLNEKYSASENANRYYKKYSKLKSAAKRLEEEIEKSKNSIAYLETVLLNIDISNNINDIDEIREELFEMGYIKKSKSKKNKKNKESNYLEFTSVDGHKILVGKNNKQNEKLTLKEASREDTWFHVKTGAGSHVIIKNNGEELSEKAIQQGAALAAYYSSFRNSSNIEVDTTIRKNIKRHPSKIPGLVLYVDFNTIIVNNPKEIVEKLIENF